MRLFRPACFASLLLVPAVLESQIRNRRWDAYARESQTVLADYLRVNTTNPPATRYWSAIPRAILDREGIGGPATGHHGDPGPIAPAYARLRGNGAQEKQSRSSITSTSFR
jgi:hypothetical protein